MSNLLFNKLDYESHALASQLQRLIISCSQSRTEYRTDAAWLIHRLAESIGSQVRDAGDLVDVHGVAKLLRMKISFVKRHDLGLHGSLMPVRGGFKSEIFREDPKRGPLTKKEKFTLAHECGHTFFYYCNGGTPARIIPRRLNGPLAQAEEGLCNVFARGLLNLPREASR